MRGKVFSITGTCYFATRKEIEKKLYECGAEFSATVTSFFFVFFCFFWFFFGPLRSLTQNIRKMYTFGSCWCRSPHL